MAQRVGRALLVLGLMGLFLVAGAPRILADGSDQVEVHLKDGKVVKGVLTREDKSEVTLKVAFGEVTISREDIATIIKPEGGEETQPSGEGPDAGPPGTELVTTILLKDGTSRRGRMRDLGDTYELVSGLGTIRIPKKDVKSLRTERVEIAAADSGEPGSASKERVDVVRDALLGIELRRPTDAYRVVEAADPYARLTMVREDPNLTVRVLATEPLEAEHRAVVDANQARFKEAFSRSLERRYRSFRSVVVEPSTLLGAPAWRVTYDGDTHEVKARVKALCYAMPLQHSVVAVEAAHLFGSGEEPDARALSQLEPVARSVSFMGSVGREGQEIWNRNLGVRFRLPEGWEARVRLLDDARPLVLLPPDGKAQFHIEVQDTGGASASGAMDSLESERKSNSQYYTREDRKNLSLGGGGGVLLVYRDFEQSQKLTRVRRLAWQRGHAVCQLVGLEPANEREANERRRPAIEALLESVVLEGGGSTAAFARRAGEAFDAYARARRQLDRRDFDKALTELDEALRLAPRFGVAFLLRGEVALRQKRYPDAIRDLTEAQNRLRSRPILTRIAEAQNQRGRALLERDYERAVKLLATASANAPEHRGHRSDLISAIEKRVRLLTEEKRFSDAERLCISARKNHPDEERFEREILRLYHRWVRQAITDEELSRARAILKKARKIDPDSTQTRSLEERIAREEEKRREGR
jgi:tetratricopeptide (TPR) repeat protein